MIVADIYDRNVNFFRQKIPIQVLATAPTRLYTVMAGSATMSGNSPRERTFQLEETLPSLPVPPLNKTLQRYLASGKYQIQVT